MNSRKLVEFVFICLQLTGALVATFEVREKCSRLLSSRPSYDGGHSSLISMPLVPRRFPMRIKFNHPIKSIELSPPSITYRSISNKELILDHRSSTKALNLAGNIFLRVYHDEEAITVESIKVGDEILCEEIPSPLPSCGSHGSIDNRPDELLRVTAAWSTGANYLLNIASYPDFVGYRIDIFFSMPVKDMQVFLESIKKRMITPQHWVLLNELSEKACKKLIHFGFSLVFDHTPKIESIMLNGNVVYGMHKQTDMLQKSSIDDKAVTRHCEDFLANEGNPWFGMEKARLLFFSFSFRPQRRYGLVVNFVFEEPIKEIRTWRFKVEKVTGDEWTLYNPGWQWKSGVQNRVDVIFSFFNHYHVKVTGIQVNGEVICGLAKPPKTQIIRSHFAKTEKLLSPDLDLFLINNLATASLVLVSLFIVFITIMFVYILIKMMKTARNERTAFYGSVGRYPRLEHPYASVNEGMNKEETQTDK